MRVTIAARGDTSRVLSDRPLRRGGLGVLVGRGPRRRPRLAGMTLIAIEWDDTAAPTAAAPCAPRPDPPARHDPVPRHRPHRRPRRRDRRAGRRGAPALGVAGALGVVLAMDEGAREGWDDAAVQAGGRPGPPRATHRRQPRLGVDEVRPLMAPGRDAVLEAARRLAREDEAANRELSRLGADWLLERVDRPRLRVLTHCNTGFLATSAWGHRLRRHP